MTVKQLWTYGITAVLTTIACWWIIHQTSPLPIYASISGVLAALLIIGYQRIYKPFWAVLAGMLWYSMFWAIRDSITGFYAPQEFWENWLSIAPTLLALLYYAGKLNLWWLLGTFSAHTVATYLMNDTNNELLAILALIALGRRQRSVYERIILVSFLWYQCYIATTKYMTPYYWDRDLIYFIALTPFLVALLTKYLSRIIHDGY